MGMKIRTHFEPGDTAYCVVGTEGVKLLTVGQVRVCITESPGIPGTIFDNYKPQKDYEESYMCVETGIGSGHVYTLGKHIFGAENDALDALEKWKKEYGNEA